MSAPRSCEALGGCQHPASECTGACRQTPGLPVWFAEPEPAHLIEDIAYTITWAVVSFASVAALLGGSGYIYARWLT